MKNTKHLQIKTTSNGVMQQYARYINGIKYVVVAATIEEADKKLNLLAKSNE